jgi:hypothetical protein
VKEEAPNDQNRKQQAKKASKRASTAGVEKLSSLVGCYPLVELNFQFGVCHGPEF